MIYELVYTSVPRGLRPGSKGYCTVLTTEGIASALQDRLEGLCGYRHLFDPGSSQNPVNFMHHKIQLAGNTWHVLSRVSDAGSDYSQRSNLLAHHVAISQDEISKIGCSPATLMRHPSFFITAWDGEPRRVSESETRSRLARLSNSVKVAKEWEKVTGDAGYAGLLAERTVESGHRSIDLVYPLGIDILSIIEEAALLLPAHEQWQTTFNSFFTKSIEDCKWKFYCDAATESKIYIGSAFDLTNLKNAHTEIDASSPLVIAARTGQKSKPQARPIIEQVRTQREKPDSLLEKKAVKNQEDDLDIFKNVQQDLRQKGTYRDPAFIKNDPPARRPPQPPSLSINSTIPIIEDEFVNSGNNFESDLKTSFGKPLRKKSKKPQYKIAVIATTILTLLIICTMTFVFILKARVPKVTEVALTNNSTASVNEQVKKKEDKTRQKEETKAKTDHIAKDDTIKKEENPKPIASVELEPNTKQETPMTKVAENNTTEVSPGNNPSPVNMPKGEISNESVASQKPDIVAKPHDLDKSIIIADLYTSLNKELSENAQINTNDKKEDSSQDDNSHEDYKNEIIIKLPENIIIPQDTVINYLLTNSKKPEKELKIKKIEKNNLTIQIPDDLKKENLLEICFASMTFLQDNQYYSIQFLSPITLVPEEKKGQLSKSKLKYRSGVDYNVGQKDKELIKRILEISLQDNLNSSDINKTLTSSLTPKSFTKSIFLGDYNENIRNDNKKIRDDYKINGDKEIAGPTLFWSYPKENIFNGIKSNPQSEFSLLKLSNKNDLYLPFIFTEDGKFNDEMKHFFNRPTNKLRFTPLGKGKSSYFYFKDYIQSSNNLLESIKDLTNFNSLWTINNNNTPFEELATKLSYKQDITSYIKDKILLSQNLISYLSTNTYMVGQGLFPSVTVSLTWNSDKNPLNHWWYDQVFKPNHKNSLNEIEQNKNIENDKDQKEKDKRTIETFQKSRILIADFQEKKEGSK